MKRRTNGIQMILLGLLGTLLAPGAVLSQDLTLEGKFATRLGVIRLVQEGKQISGKLIWVAETCPFKRGDEVLKGLLLEDSLSGKWRYCLRGAACKGDDWAPLVLLIARGGKLLSGAAHFQKTGCNIGGKGKGDGLVISKLKPAPPAPPKPMEAPRATPDAGTAQVATSASDVPPPLQDENGQPMEEEEKRLDPKQYEKNAGTWRGAMEEGSAQMGAGFFERARKAFFKATELDPTRPEAFNGIGVTYYGRGDYEEALTWYKKALEVDPDFADAYYNMACIYALTKKIPLATRYLQIAVLNGYVEHAAMEEDPDLDNLRKDPAYQEILQLMKTKQK